MATKKEIRRRVKKNENRIAEKIGGRTTFNSGAGIDKGDARVVGSWRIESKETSNKSISITSKIWETIANAAIKSGEKPALHLEIRNRFGRPLRLVVLSADDFYELANDDHSQDTE